MRGEHGHSRPRVHRFPSGAVTFLAGLESDNSKTYWDAHRATWEESVKAPVEAFMADLEPEYGPLRTFRPNRDVRFSNDKSPYKTWVGITTSERAVGGVGSFLRLESTKMRLACGSMVMAPDQLDRFRAAIVDPHAGTEFDRVRQTLAERSLEVGPGKEPPLKRVPNGYPADHPRADVLRWKGAVVIKEFKRVNWMYGPRAVDRVHLVWRGAAPLLDWIGEHVGESRKPPPRRPGR